MAIKKKGCSIRDLAKYVGVSPGTVSRVLNNKPSNVKITEATRKKVMDAARELNYSPNINARRLFTNRSQVIGLLVPAHKKDDNSHTLGDNNLIKTMSGIEMVVVERGYRLLLLFQNEAFMTRREYMDIFNEKSVDGLLIWGASDQDNYVHELREADYPSVLINSHPTDVDQLNFIGNDNVGGSRSAVEHLIEKGHQRIACITGTRGHSIAEQRLQGYKDALQAHGLPIDESLIMNGDYLIAGGYRCMQELIEHHAGQFTAVAAANDNSALGAMRAIHDAGLTIPNDIAITGGDGMQSPQLFDPPITTFQVDNLNVGRRGTELLLDLIDGKQKEPVYEILPTQLLVRQST